MSKVVVLGGGVIGLSTAYQLARKNAGQVVLLEKGQVGDGSSSRAAGITTGLLWTDTGVRVRQIGLSIFEELSDELDGYTYHNEHGCINVFTPSQWAEREKLLPIYDRLRVPYDILTGPEIRERWPALNSPDDFTGLHDARGGYSEPEEYLVALARRVRELGVEIREGEQALEFLTEKGRVTGVRTRTGRYEADAVVSTVHVWSLPLLNGVKLRVPIKSFVHQRYVTTPLAEPFIAPPVNVDPFEAYVRPAHGGRILMGCETPGREEHRVTSIDFEMTDLSTPTTVRDESLARVQDFVPALAGARWEDERVGLLSFSADGEPIMGPVSQWPGLFVGASFHSGGFSYNTAAGLLLAEYVVDGKTSTDVSAFSPDRFIGHEEETERYLAETVTQAHAVHRRH